MLEKPKNESVQLPCRPDENTDASGCPANLPISRLYVELAQKAVPEELRVEHHLAEGATYGEALAMALFNAAIGGRVTAAHEIREGVEGKANQRRNPVTAEKFELVVAYEPPLSRMLSEGTTDEKKSNCES
jgi:hypothetical protein